jgi:hypothetical protein
LGKTAVALIMGGKPSCYDNGGKPTFPFAESPLP